tara:strand:+ start:1120 stop:1344 length:225 start_codon:yes stop_codon:yes gene_type:complete
MNLELFNLNGHGQFVWPAFIFAFSICFALYFKTKKELQEQEKLFLNEFKNLENIKTKVQDKKENIEEVLSGSSI